MKLKLIISICLLSFCAKAQQVPSKVENVDFLVTFGENAEKKWGDDDNVQITFFAVPKKENKPIYIKVFDPNVGGQFDQVNKGFNSNTKFSIYGGKGSYSNKDARSIDPTGNFKSGILMDSKVFGPENKYDGKWYTFGPFNPQEGEFDDELNSFVFKVICEGVTGNDGNLYKYFLSTEMNSLKAVEGGNSFSYKLKIRLKKKAGEVAHFYPFINDQIVSVTQFNFDFDKNGYIRLTSLIKKSHEMKISGDGNWSKSKHIIKPEEHNTSLDFHIISKNEFDNDIAIYMLDQYKNAIPFFSTPLGGVPKYKYKIDVQYQFD